ncbi:hypothetical protein HG530_013725 [Fusarium avenaceum]|nr:hypothetical protein HG530_013725 [Fusarium avenaceum]
MARYPFTPLPTGSIRLLRLSPVAADSSSIICGTLEVHDLQTSLPFIALSYEWGPPEANHPSLYLRGGTVPLRSNAAAALTTLRDHHNVMRIWIDMVCIDQENIPERTAQVQMMDAIYLRAAEVLIWLGQEDDLTELACDSAIKIARYGGLPPSRKSRNFSQLKIMRGLEVAAREQKELFTTHPEKENGPERTTAKYKEPGLLTAYERAAIYEAEGRRVNQETEFLADFAAFDNKDEVSEMAAQLNAIDLQWTTSFMERQLRQNLFRNPGVIPPASAPMKWDSSMLSHQNRTIVDQLNLSGPVDLVWHSLTSLFSRSWFFRVWMLQELVLAKEPTIIVGTLALSWDALMFTDTFIWELGLFGSRNSRASHMAIQMDIQRDSYWGKGGPRDVEGGATLDQLLTILRASDCSEPRDKVFGILGMVDKRHKDAITVDYNIPLSEIYGSVTRYEITSSRTLDALRFVAPNMSPDLPSWVSDYRIRTIGSEMFPVARDNDMDAASGRLVTTNLINSESAKRSPSTLRLRGRYVGKIEHLGAKMQLTDPYKKDLSRQKRPALNMRSHLRQHQMVQMVIDQWRGLCVARSSDPYPQYRPGEAGAFPPSDQSLISAFWRTACADMFLGGGGFTAAHEWEAVQCILHHQVDDLPEAKLPNLSVDEYLDCMLLGMGGRLRADWYGVDTFWKYAGSMSAHKRFFILGGGFIGTGPTYLKEGDEVWVLEGGVMPFILRAVDLSEGTAKKVTESGEKHVRELVGPAYVHGIMRGEAWGNGDDGVVEVVLV